MMAQEIEQRSCFARSSAEVHIGDPDRPVVTALKHGLPPPSCPAPTAAPSSTSACIQRSASTLLSDRQSDIDFDNYTNSELKLKNEIAKNDECISKLLLADERTATLISYSMRRDSCRGR